MSKYPTTLGGRLRMLHAMAGSKNDQERLAAMRAIDALLEKHRKSWVDLTAMEENIDELAGLMSQLGAQKLPAFVFQEGEDDDVERAFKADRKEIRWRLPQVQHRLGAGRGAIRRHIECSSKARRRR